MTLAPASLLLLFLGVSSLAACGGTTDLPTSDAASGVVPSSPATSSPSTSKPSGPKTPETSAEACSSAQQCAGHGCSADPVAGTCGQCFTVRGLGERCDEPGVGCNPSARCLKGVCVSTRKTLGEPCGLYPKGGDQGDCDDELYCAGAPAVEQGSCAPRVPWGGACSSGYGEVPCAIRAICDHGKCVENRSLEIGEACGDRFCREGLFCEPDVLTCQPGKIPEGVPCGVVNGTLIEGRCEAGTVCGDPAWPNGGGGDATQSRCVALPPSGEPCINGLCAAGLACFYPEGKDLPRCAPPLQEGEPCASGYGEPQCAKGLECRAEVCRSACR